MRCNMTTKAELTHCAMEPKLRQLFPTDDNFAAASADSALHGALETFTKFKMEVAKFGICMGLPADIVSVLRKSSSSVRIPKRLRS